MEALRVAQLPASQPIPQVRDDAFGRLDPGVGPEQEVLYLLDRVHPSGRTEEAREPGAEARACVPEPLLQAHGGTRPPGIGRFRKTDGKARMAMQGVIVASRELAAGGDGGHPSGAAPVVG